MNKLKFNRFGKVDIWAIGALLMLAILFSFIISGNILVCAMKSSSETIENFEDNVVVVVLDPKISKINKIHNAKFFSGIEIESIKDLTKKDNALCGCHKNKFKQILKITLKEHSKENVLATIDILKNMDGIYSVEPNYIYDLAIAPNDPDYSSNLLWGLNGTNGIGMPMAWDIGRGSNAVRVGIIDTGIATHPDLNANLVTGWDTFNNTVTTTDDTHSHGTHVAGTIGAIGNNSTGVVGVNWSVSLVPLQASNTNNQFFATDAVEAIEWAEDLCGTANQIDVLNYSVGGFGKTTAVREAARNYCGLFVWSAGNEETDVDIRVGSNGTFNLPNLISVGALKSDNARPSVADWGYDNNGNSQGSNYSRNGTNVHIYAPGDGIRSTVPNNGYDSKSGTSMAAPHVAGVAALMLSINSTMSGFSGSTLGARLKTVLVNSANTISITIPATSGGTSIQNVKRLNAYKALASVALQYTTSGNNVTITGRNFNPNDTLVLPDTINGNSVTEIGASAFAGCTQLSQITIPASVTSIGDNAFKNCTSLTTVNFESPSSLTSIGASAFAGCTQLSQITIPSGVTSIGALAFAGCTQLSQISLPSSIESIGMEAFVPGISLTGYGGDGTNINLIIVDGTKQSFVDNGWTGFNIVELSAAGPLTVTSGQLKGEIGIPTYFNNRMIEAIGENAFAGQAELTGITLPTSVTSIGASAFANCAELEYATYFSITGLASTPNQTASYIDSYYTERDLGIQLIQDYTYRLSFYYSNLTATTDISNVFTSLGVGENSFTSELQAQKAFSSSSGKQVIVFTPTAEQLATSKKLWCRFIKTETPQSVSIDISNIEVNVGMRDIDISSFVGCEKLASPGLAYGLLPNGTYAVSGLSNDWQAIIPVLSKTLFIPSYHNGVEVTQIDADAFANEDRIKWVFVQSKISTIGNGAFQNCTNLETVNLSATAVTRIENKTFDSCALGAFSFPSNLTYIGADAFIRAGTVKNMPDSVTTIGDYAFAYRPDAIGAYLPNNLYSIGAYAFAYCDDFLLTNENTGLTIIGPFAFCNTKLTANTQIPEYVTTIGESAFMDSGFSANFAFPVRNRIASIGHRAFRNCGLTRIVLPTTITTIGNEAFNDNANLTVYTNFNSRPAGWSTSWNGSERPVVWGCTLASTRTFVVSFTKTASNPTNTNAPNGITQPYRSGYSFGGWYTASDYSGTQYMDMTTAPNGTLYAKWTENSCVAEGTLITLADGSQVAVEDLSGEDNLLVWNMLTGQFDSAPILFIDSDPYTEYEITHLYFSDGTEVKIIDEHGFWNISQNQYVFLRNDAGKYIGNWFNKQSYDSDGNMIYTAVQLIDVNVYNEYTTAWSPVTYGHLCYYVNGMLSMPGATEGLINIFEVNGTTMQYDTEAFAADIATYGLFTYEEFAELIPITEEVFNAFNGQYLKISIGKGLIGMDGIVALVERYAPFLQTDEDVTPNTESEINNGRQNRGNHYGWNNDNLHGHNGRNKGIGHQD